ncbi:MAG: VWA-like domain-containing protein [Pseudomonadota bacterium]
MNIHSDRAALALAQLAERDPALGLLALWCVHRDGDVTETDGETIRYARDFPDLPKHEQIGLAGHHILHVTLRHSARAGAMAGRFGRRFDPDLYALVTDAIVNDTLLLAEHALPRPAVTLIGLLQSIGRPASSPVSALSEWDADTLYLALERDENARRRAEDYAAAQRFTPDLAPDAKEDSQRDADWRGHMARAMEAGRQAGTGIGKASGVLADMAPARIPWEKRLRRLLLRAAQEHPRLSTKRPANRWVAMHAVATGPEPVFEPGFLRDARRPKIVIALDTSSSVDDLTLSLFAGEAAGVARRTGAKCIILGFDTQLHSEEVMGGGTWETRLTAFQMRRGGGTSFVPVMDRVRQIAPSIAIILTDLEGPHGDPPGVPVLWAVPETDPGTAPFGDVLCLSG